MNPTPASARFPSPEPPGGEEALLEAIRRRDAATTERLVLQWVHRRGLTSLERFRDTTLGRSEGQAAVLWLTDRLGGEPLPSAPAAGSEAITVDPIAVDPIAAELNPPETIETEALGMETGAPETVAVETSAPQTVAPETLPPRPDPIGPTNPGLAPPTDGDPAPASLEIERAFDDLAAAFPRPPAAGRPDPAPAEAPLLSQPVSWQPGSSPDPFEAFSLEPLSFGSLPLALEAPDSEASARAQLESLEADAIASPDRAEPGVTAPAQPQGRGAALRRPLQGGLGALRRVKSLMRDCLDEALGTFQPDRPEEFDGPFVDEALDGATAAGQGPGGTTAGAPTAGDAARAVTPSAAAGPPAQPALPVGAEPARAPRVRPDGRPAPAPSSLDELRSWLPDDDLPRAC